jgi:hypothetical protein
MALNNLKGGRKMKAVVVVLMGVLLSVGVCSFAVDERKEISMENAMKALCGTWTNPGGEGSDKDIYYSDGTFELYDTVESLAPFAKEKYKILDAWTDNDGNIWIFSERTFVYSKYALYKISDAGAVIEIAPLFDNKNLDGVDIENMTFPYKSYRQ